MYFAIMQHLPGFIESLAPTINHYGYFAVGGLVMIEDFGIPVPGETTLIAAAAFAGLGQLNILLVVLVAFIAAVVGDNIGYAIGDFGGRPLVERFGKYFFLTAERLDKAEAFFKRNGGKVVVIARFIEGLRQANGIIAGISDMRWSRFLAYNSLGAALWVGLWSSIGYFGGSHINTIYKYGIDISLGLLIVLLAYIAYRFLRHRHSSK